MCVSVSPRTPVEFSGTVLYAAEAMQGGDLVHVLGYQNKVGPASGLRALTSWIPGFRSGNAMILPLPAEPRTMTKLNVIDTSACPDILQEMAQTVDPPLPTLETYARSRMRSLSAPPPVQVFEAAGIYTVVLAQDARDIPGALHQVPRAKRPRLNPALFDAYAKWYPGWTIALCCFNNLRARLALPLLWWYRPMHPDRLFLPALDCHTGAVPDLDAEVRVDHVLAVSSHRLQQGLAFYPSTVSREVAPYVPRRLLGQRMGEEILNGDFVCEVEDVVAGRFRALRWPPPGVM